MSWLINYDVYRFVMNKKMSRPAIAALCIPLICLVTSSLILMTGCQDRPEITTHRIQLQQVDDDDSNLPPMMRGRSSSNKPERMVVAFIENGNSTWYFKVKGDPATVKKFEPQWSAYIKSITFDPSGNPQGDVPTNWTEGRKRMMVDKTYNIGDDADPLQLDISSLSAGQDLALNVNRWLNQLGLPNVGQDQLSSVLNQMETAAGTMMLFDQTRSGESSTVSNDPGNNEESNNQSETSKGPFQFEAPAGWEQGKINSVVLLRYHKKNDGDENKMASISVSVLPADINEWVPNVQRWCGEIGLDDYSTEKIESMTRQVTVSSKDAQRIDLVSSEENGEARYAVMLKHAGQAWFFKLYGDKQMVADATPDFETFLTTIKFDQ